MPNNHLLQKDSKTFSQKKFIYRKFEHLIHQI